MFLNNAPFGGKIFAKQRARTSARLFSVRPVGLARMPGCCQAELPSVGLVIEPQRERYVWTRCEVHCLMCGRLLGRLLGNRSTDTTIVFIAFRPMNPPGPIVVWSMPGPIRCCTCRGIGTVDEVEIFSTYVRVTAAADPPVKLGRGRPVRPFLDKPECTPLQAALAEL